jgi:outer membrane protein
MKCTSPRGLLILAAALMAMGVAPAHADNLLDIYHQAQANDNAWAGARYHHDASVEKGPQGRALLLPSVIFSAGASKNSIDKTSPTSEMARYDSSNYTVQLTQPLYRRQNFSAYAQGRSAVTQAEAELAIARQDLILRTSQAYFDVLAAEDTLEFTRTEKSAIAGQRELAERNFTVGTATIVDVHEARARYDLAVAQEVAADNALKVKREALTTLTNSPTPALARLAQHLPLQTPDPQDVDHWVHAAQGQNPRIKVQEQLLAIASEEVKRRRGGHYPTLDLIAAHNYSKSGSVFFPGTTEYTANQVGVQLQVPLFQGGAIQSQVRESLAQAGQARQGLEQTKRQTTQESREAYLAVTGGIAQVQALEQARVSTQKALESTQLGYETGVRTGVDVLNAQRDLYRTRRDLAQARYAYLLSRLRLKNAVGTLSEADITELNGLLAGG